MSLEEGGSTITQQVAKNLFLSQKKEFTRKVAEIFLAFDLEATYTKREILEFYVNSSYFGLGCTGIGQAAPAMLGVAPANMTLDQAALMAGIPNEPGSTPPIGRQQRRVAMSYSCRWRNMVLCLSCFGVLTQKRAFRSKC